MAAKGRTSKDVYDVAEVRDLSAEVQVARALALLQIQRPQIRLKAAVSLA